MARAPFGSPLNTPAMRKAAAATAQLAGSISPDAGMRIDPGSNAPAPKSALNTPAMQRALNATAQLAGSVSPEAGMRLDPDSRQAPFASSLHSPAVRDALTALAQGGGQGASQIVFLKQALNGGEISPELWARFDIPRYSQGCECLLNMVPLPGGGIAKRPGFIEVGAVGDEDRDIGARLFPWIYSASLAFMLIFMTESGGQTPAMIYWTTNSGFVKPRESGVTLPYKGDDIFEVCCCQVGKIIYMAHPKYPPGKLIVEVENTDDHTYEFFLPKFKYEVINFTTQTPHCGIESITTAGGESNADTVPGKYKVCAVDKDTGREGLCPTAGTAELPPPTSNGFHWVIKAGHVENASEYRVYKLRGGEYGFIGRILPENDLEFHDFNYSPDTTDQPPTEQHFFTKAGDYPAIVFMHQQRLGWAATDNDPLTIWLSQTSNFECLDYKTPPKDDDAIEVTLASSQANRILWCVSDRTGLAVGTQGEEWFLTGANGEASLSPSSLSFQPQTRYGTEPYLQPLRAASSLLFVQRGGKIIRDLGYSFAADRYEAKDLTLLARHLFHFANIKDWCWQATPHNILWIVTDKSNLVGLTYLPDQEVCAWHRHKSWGYFRSCATMADKQGRPRLWVTVMRQVPDAQDPEKTTRAVFLEILDNFYEGKPDAYNGGILVCGDWRLTSFLDHGSEYEARCIPCMPEASGGSGGTALRVKKVNAVKCRVMNSASFQARVLSQDAKPSAALPVPLQGLPLPTVQVGTARYKGYVEGADWNTPLGAGFREGSKLELICDGDFPVTILGLTLACDVAGEAGGQI